MIFTQANIEDYLRQHMARRLEEWLNVLTVRVQNKWQEYDKGEYTEHYAETGATVTRRGKMFCAAVFSGLGAYILEYGSGTEMTLSTVDEIGQFGNPDLESYLMSSGFNKMREARGYTILGRKKGDKIHRPNGSDYYSSGNYENLDLQRASTIKKAKHQLEDYIPQQALHIIENEFIAMIPEMDEELEGLTTLAIDTIVTESFTLP